MLAAEVLPYSAMQSITRSAGLEARADGGDDPGVGLVVDEQVDLVEGDPGVGDDLA